MGTVVVAGAGNAALCAAIAAAQAGARVAVLEAAPEAESGGNSRFTDGAIRCAFDSAAQLAALIKDAADADIAPYPAAAFFADLIKVSDGRANPNLARTLADNSAATMRWLAANGVGFELIYDNQAHRRGGRWRFFGNLPVRATGAGVGLVAALHQRARDEGVQFFYQTKVTGLKVHSESGAKTTRGVLVETNQQTAARLSSFFSLRRQEIRRAEKQEIHSARSGEEKQEMIAAAIDADAVVLACGGFEASDAMRAQYLGEKWREVKVRGTKHNSGGGLQAALAAGATPAGQWDGCHAVAADAAAPRFGDFNSQGDIWKKHSYPYGIIINKNGRRFVDEGADIRNYTYAKYGKEILRQPGQIAWQIFDGKVQSLLRAEYRRPQASVIKSQTMDAFAERLAEAGVDREGFLQTVAAYNRAVCEGAFAPDKKDGKTTRGLNPNKSNWAQTIDAPPLLAYPVRCAITFTFGGLKADANARVLEGEDKPIAGLFAAGEMIGGLFYGNYPGGAGLMSGAVFGKIAGENAARFAAAAAPR